MEKLRSKVNQQEFVATFRNHLPAVSKYLARRVSLSDVEDLASDIFEIAWRKRQDFQEGSELAWLYRIGGYVVANHRRKEANRAWLPLLDTDAAAPSAEDLGIANVSIAQAWSKLKPSDRNILALSTFDGLSVTELAVALEISPNTASQRLGRARGRFAELLETKLSD
jgi:RNA polymerase sigma-70 factor (ECF subfamily)